MHYYVYDRPANAECHETPARFSFMPPVPDEAPYCIEVYREGALAYRFEDVRCNFYTPAQVMESGAYTYRILTSKGRTLVQAPFSIAPDAVKTPLPARAGRYEAIGAHPRIWLSPQDLPAAREAVRTTLCGEWAAFMQSGVTPWLDAPVKQEPARYPGDVRVIPLWRQLYTDCQEALYAVKHCAVAYRLTDDARCLDMARRTLLALADWDLDGSTARSYNDEAAFRVLTALAWGYDWLYDALDESERARVHHALLLRGRELFHYVRDEIAIHIRLLDSHGVRSLSMSLVPAALALYGDEPEARDWLDYTIEYFACLFTPWGGEDGGWAEGPTYWQSGMSFFAQAVSLLYKATGVDLFARPFFQNTGDFILNAYCTDTRFMGFGDMSDLGDYPGLKAGYTMRILSAVSQNPNAPQYADYFARSKIRGKGTEGMFYNYGWWNFDFDELFFRLLYRDAPAPRAPKNGLRLAHFADIGWAFIHKDMADPARHLAFAFKSSPYGSVSHSHGDQNAFVLHAFGEPLAIHSGYYIGFFSSMHLNWRRQTKSKNAITIGGVGQLASLRKTTRAESMNGSAKSMYDELIAANGRITACESHEGFIYLRGDATNAFFCTVPGVRAALRHVLFVDETFFVFIDEVSLNVPERIDFRLHALHPFQLNAHGADMTGKRAGMSVRFDQPMDITQSDVFEGVDTAETAGLAPQWHLCATTREASSNHVLASVLYPYALGEQAPIALTREGEAWHLRFGERVYQITRSGEGYKAQG